MVAVAAAGCGVDEPSSESPDSLGTEGSFNAPVGDSCSLDIPLCDRGFGICKAAVCRRQCDVVGHWGRCPDDSRAMIDYERAIVSGQEQVVSQSCYCLPE